MKGEIRRSFRDGIGQISRYVCSIEKKNNGQDYEPDSLVSKYNSVGRYLREKRKLNLNHDTAFNYSRDVLSKNANNSKTPGKVQDKKSRSLYTRGNFSAERQQGTMSRCVWLFICYHFASKVCIQFVNLWRRSLYLF